MRGKVAVLGAGPYQISGIRRLKEKGYTVVALDGDPSAVGASEADVFAVVDIVDPEAVLAWLEKNGHRDMIACLSFCTDAALPAVGRVNEAWSLKGLKPAMVQVSLDKGTQRRIMASAGWPVPSFQITASSDEVGAVGLPCVVKPVDGSGSRGVVVVRREEDLKSAIDRALELSRSKRCIVESLILGTEYTSENLVVNGKVHTLGISEKRKPVGNLTVSSELLYHSPRALEYKDTIDRVMGTYLKAAGIDNTIVHAELIHDERDGRMYLVEASLRSGGFGIFDRILPYLTGQDVVGATIDVLLGEPLEWRPCPERFAMMNFLSGNPGRILDMRVADRYFQDFEGAAVEYGFLRNKGDIVGALQADNDRVAYILTYGMNWQDTLFLSRLVEYAMEIVVE